MKKLMVAALSAISLSAIAAENLEQTLKKGTPSICSFYANFGYYSGCQLYGSLLNKDLVLQGYAEIPAKLLFSDQIAF